MVIFCFKRLKVLKQPNLKQNGTEKKNIKSVEMDDRNTDTDVDIKKTDQTNNHQLQPSKSQLVGISVEMNQLLYFKRNYDWV